MFLIILYLIRRKFKAYWPRRNKLKEMAAEYERKRESRSDLKFSLTILFLVKDNDI